MHVDFDLYEDEEFVLEEIVKLEENSDTLYCLTVDSPSHTFLVDGGIPTCNSESAKKETDLKSRAGYVISSIARLGRASGVHLILATQRPDAKLIPGETKANLPGRVCCGRVDTNASRMILDNMSGTSIKPFPKGRIYVQAHGVGNHAQGFFASPEWYDEYLEEKGIEIQQISGENSLETHIRKNKQDDGDFGWTVEDEEISEIFS